MSLELDAVIESCVGMLQSNPQRTREEIALQLNRWEEAGLISRQMRAVIVRRLGKSQQDRSTPEPDENI
jgi:hypothetical protein